MTPADFNHCMAALCDYYGDKAFPPRTRDILFRLLIGLEKSSLLRVIDLVAEEHSRAPTIAAIKKAALPFLRDSEQRRQRLEVERLEEAREQCKLCGFTGYVMALLRANPLAEFSFRCPACSAARSRKLDERIPLWSDELKATYIPVSLRMESHEPARKLQRETVRQAIEKRGALRPANADLGAMAEGFARLAMSGELDRKLRQEGDTCE